MELFIKDHIDDITYKSELTPHPVITKRYYVLSGCGVNSPKQLTLLLQSYRKLWAH